MEKKVTIKDIARLANVSVGTVDRVIHQRGEVSDDSRERILAIIDKTGYKPNLLARTLGANKNYHIAALLPDPSQDEYWSMATEGIIHARSEWMQYGVRLSIVHFNLYDKQTFDSKASEVLQLQPDGVLLAPIFHNEAERFIASCSLKKIPFVLINNAIRKAEPLCFVGQDLYQSGRVGAELLHMNQPDSGVYAILHVYDDIHHSVHLYEKEQGFKDYFNELQTENNSVVSFDLNYTHEPTLEKELKDLLLQPDLRGILVTTSKGASTVSRLAHHIKHRKVRLVAYDLLQDNLTYLNNGVIDFLINQNPRKQAYIGISQLGNHLALARTCPPAYHFPLEIISRQNLKTYLTANIV
jgi:LacI family transcriptional regulator